MPRWTPEQDEILIAYANLGAAEVRKVLLKEGAKHTEAAIVKRASRLKVTLTRYEVCPRCGAKVKKLNRDGVCRDCYVEQMIQRQKLRAERIEQELRQQPSIEKELELRALRRKNERRAKR